MNPQFRVTTRTGEPIAEGHQLKVDNNLPVTYMGIAVEPWGDDNTGEWHPGEILVRYSWGAIEAVTDARARVTINEI
ncbi:hypothetical protein ABR737_00100 [Streptomyces sp. Edi2]|uniref:hypothetical protein n=1 Tax=Streptomyces sp. Edi2 TaxID=3162528 RepID=UPI0033065EDE